MGARKGFRATAGVAVLVLATVAAAVAAESSSSRPEASRRDRGSLTVLDLYGSYEDMGRQEVELLGPIAGDAADLYLDRWGRVVRSHGLQARVLNRLVLPLWSALGGWRDDSGFFDHMAGIGESLHTTGTEGVRLVYGAVFGGGSTVFAATRATTADGGALIGRNVDWADDTGRRRPVVRRYHPDNGDLVHLAVSWPLIPVPFVGLNEAGLAISINFFDADVMIGFGLPRYLYRRVLQRARTVDEAIALLAEDGNRGGAAILILADAGGAIALAECSAKHCAFHRPAEDWLGQSNHSRTSEMRDHDEGRTADSARRRAAMEAAVQPHLGAITPAVAAAILRDRANSPFINEPTVANLRVLNAVVVQPAAKVLWHSTTMQPLAPFGEMVPLSVDGAPAAVAPLPADPRLASADFARAVEVVAAMRQAERIYQGGRVGDAGAIWDRLASDDPPLLEPRRLAWARARARWSNGELAEADALLAAADVDAAPFEVQAYAKVARAIIADRLGRRADALTGYRAAASFLDAHAEYDAPWLVGSLRTWIGAGRARPQIEGRFPAMPDLQNIPR